MTRFIKTGSMIFAAGLLAVACAQQDGADAAAVSVEPATLEVEATVPGTIKPGASVKFAHSLRGEIDASRSGTVDIQVTEQYSDGTLRLTATGDTGLSVFGASKTAQFAMDGKGTHTWSVNFQADADGVYYINVLANVEVEGHPASMRAYAVRLKIGEGVLEQKPENGALEQLSDGEIAVVMEADEVIE